MSRTRKSFRQTAPLFAVALIAALASAFVSMSLVAQPVQRIPSLGDAKVSTIPKGVRPPSVDWSIYSMKIEQGVFIKTELRNLSKTWSPAPLVRFTAFKSFAATQSPPNSSGDTTSAGGNMSQLLGDAQTPGVSAGEVLSVPAWSIPKAFSECSEITAEVDFKRSLPDSHWANNKVTIKTKCGATPATVHYGVMRPIQ